MPDRTISEWAAAIVAHSDTHPTHGVNCICMDEFARELRNAVLASIPEPRWEGNRLNKKHMNKRERVRHVLRMVQSPL